MFNLTESPVASVPVGVTEDGLPVAVQVVGRRNADADVLYVAGMVEDTLGRGVIDDRSGTGSTIGAEGLPTR